MNGGFNFITDFINFCLTFLTYSLLDLGDGQFLERCDHQDRLFCDVFETTNNRDYFMIITIIGPTINRSND